MKCSLCDKPYKKSRTPSGKWLYEKQCRCNRGITANDTSRLELNTGRKGPKPLNG